VVDFCGNLDIYSSAKSFVEASKIVDGKIPNFHRPWTEGE